MFVFIIFLLHHPFYYLLSMASFSANLSDLPSRVSKNFRGAELMIKAPGVRNATISGDRNGNTTALKGLQ